MRITAIVSFYNRADALRKVLYCLSCQSVVPDEVIVTDDGSREDIAARLRESLTCCGYSIKYIRQSDKGFRLAKCRNNAIREAQGDYLIFLDQDILATRGYIGAFAGHGRPGEFLVAFPVMLTEEQSLRVGDAMIAAGNYGDLVTDDQLRQIHRQYRKDSFYYWVRKIFGTYGPRPKVRGGCFGVAREHLVHVDGFDENYQGWGNEDDDLGRRLYRAGVVGRTVFRTDYPLHLYHPEYRPAGNRAERRVNRPYFEARINEIRRGDFRAVNGISNPLDPEEVEVLQLK